MGGLGAGLRRQDWDLSKLAVFEKNFYIEHPAVTARTEDWAADWRRSKDITCVGAGIPKPCMTFEEASMPEYVLKEVLKQGFKERKLRIIYFFHDAVFSSPTFRFFSNGSHFFLLHHK